MLGIINIQLYITIILSRLNAVRDIACSRYRWTTHAHKHTQTAAALVASEHVIEAGQFSSLLSLSQHKYCVVIRALSVICPHSCGAVESSVFHIQHTRLYIFWMVPSIPHTAVEHIPYHQIPYGIISDACPCHLLFTYLVIYLYLHGIVALYPLRHSIYVDGYQWYSCRRLRMCVAQLRGRALP